MNDVSDILEQRQFVSSLIFSVLTGKITVKNALLKFPHGTEDKSIQAAWHAVLHYESDEDLRNKDFNYAQEQDEYLEFIAFTLKEGKSLPLNIINSYNEYHPKAMIPEEDGIKGVIKRLFRFII